MLTQKQFDVLTCLERENRELTQRELSELTGMSLGSVNKILNAFNEHGFIKGTFLTASGVQALEPYRVRRAIFIAAGFGARLAPITLNTPKPLVRVNGTRIIDTMLDAVVAAEIPEIVIVRGYLGEQFDQLLYKYPQIKFAENPIFNESNNISSAMCVRYLFQNAYVLDADLILKNPGLIRKYEYRTNLLGIPVERSDDWCVTVDKSGYVNSMCVGVEHGYREVGISYWDAEDGARMAEDMDTVYRAPGGKERYWEQTALVYKKEHYKVALRQCSATDVIEIDTFSELKRIDPAYNL